MKKSTSKKIIGALKSGAKTLSYLTKLTGSTKVSTRISDLRMQGYVIRNTRTAKKINGELVYVSKYTLIATPNWL